MCRDIGAGEAAEAVIAIAAAVLRGCQLVVDEGDLALHLGVGRRDQRVEAFEIGDVALKALGAGRRAGAERGDRELLRQEGTGQPCLFLAAHPHGHVERFVADRSEEHTSELQSLMRISYAVFCLKKKKQLHQTSYVE